MCKSKVLKLNHLNLHFTTVLTEILLALLKLKHKWFCLNVALHRFTSFWLCVCNQINRKLKSSLMITAIIRTQILYVANPDVS
jgi:hypothetical protein